MEACGGSGGIIILLLDPESMVAPVQRGRPPAPSPAPAHFGSPTREGSAPPAAVNDEDMTRMKGKCAVYEFGQKIVAHRQARS